MAEHVGAGAFDRDRFFAELAAAPRHLGRAKIVVTDAERADLAAAAIAWRMEQAGLDELGRAALLLVALKGVPPGSGAGLLEEAYARGDNREREAVLRVLAFAEWGVALVPLAVEACRTNVQTVFEALCCENDFPAEHFPDLSFNQMVLKALFTGVPLARVSGLASRTNPELSRMASDYSAERRAAGRGVPSDIGVLWGEAPGRGMRA